MIWLRMLRPKGRGPPVPTRNPRHPSNGIDHEGMPHGFQGLDVARTVAVRVALRKVHSVTVRERLEQTPLAFTVRVGRKNAARVAVLIGFQLCGQDVRARPGNAPGV